MFSVNTEESLQLALASESSMRETDTSIVEDTARPSKVEAPSKKDAFSSPQNELDASAAAMLERLEKLKKRKSAWDQAKEELKAEGVYVDGKTLPSLYQGGWANGRLSCVNLSESIRI